MEDVDAATMSSGHTLEVDFLDETSRTLHEPRKATKDDDADADTDADDDADTDADAEADDAVVVVPMETVPGIPAEKPRSSSLLLNKCVAQLANKAYRRVSAKSLVLSRAYLTEIAMVRFDELEIGVKLGKGSFSDVQ
jgi:hypothetical protein